MSNYVLVAGQILSVLVIVGGLAIAFWQIWVLAGKLARLRNDGDIRPRAPVIAQGSERQEQPLPPPGRIAVRSDRWGPVDRSH